VCPDPQIVGLHAAPRLIRPQGVKFEVRKSFSGGMHEKWSVGSASRRGRRQEQWREIPLSKRLEVVKLYFEGLSYDEIVKRTGVAKGTVAAIIEELKEGRFPQVEHLSDLVNEIRDLAVALRKVGMASSEANLLFILLKRFIGLGVEPAHLET